MGKGGGSRPDECGEGRSDDVLFNVSVPDQLLSTPRSSREEAPRYTHPSGGVDGFCSWSTQSGVIERARVVWQGLVITRSRDSAHVRD